MQGAARDPAGAEQVPDQGAIIGYAIGTWHRGRISPTCTSRHLGTKISLAFPKSGKKPEAGFDEFTVVGYLQERHERV